MAFTHADEWAGESGVEKKQLIIMELNLKNKVLEALKNDYNQKIINSNDFYFLKAQEALHHFLEIKLNNETEEYLITHKKNYDELKQLFEDSEELNEFGKAIFTLISYCDLKAYKKNDFNLYDDKRVLALAFVRMNNWVEQLLTYKFENQLSEGSVKNAIDYLLNPIDNFTMLSENHRSQISENLFKKEYNKNTFKEDFINFFSELSINVKNPLNYTHLLTRISYDISTEWKNQGIIGLISPDGTGWQENAIKDSNNVNPIVLWNHKKPNGKENTLKLLRQCIEENGFFRILYTYKHKVFYIAEIIDFATNQQELSNYKWEKEFPNIVWYNERFSDYQDGSKSASWIYLAKKIYKVSPNEFKDFKYFKSFGYPSVGCQAPIVSYKSEIEMANQKLIEIRKSILEYKKQIILQGPPGTGKTREAKLIAKEIINNNLIDSQTIHTKKLTKDLIKNSLKVGEKIKGKSNIEFEILKLDKNVVLIKSETSKPWKPSYNKIINSFENRLWEQKGRTGGYKAYEDAIAKYFYDNKSILIKEVEETINKKEDFIKILQFHPSYTFEDFVRGIVAKPNEDAEGILYEAENKILAKLSEDAQNDIENNYVLIIDEINRANLSSVLGELIYALEYRGEEVESMYEVDGSQKLILPSNLYIIGTMNTADRSVGHIDYAIRRRFAFVEVLPEKLEDNDEIFFNTSDFIDVAKLFIKVGEDQVLDFEKAENSDFLSDDFSAKDVALGHSYFIAEKKKISEDNKQEYFNMKMKYEVIPILNEYLKDGVFNEKATVKIKEIEQRFA